MLSRIKDDVTLLLVLLELSSSAMVLPRPPSSPNHIRQDYVVTDSKAYNEKVSPAFFQSTNVEKPDVDDIKLLEIEIQDIDDKKPMTMNGIMEAVLDEEMEQSNETYPSPEVMPNSILGVRDVGLSPRFRMDATKPDKTFLLRGLDEKLYYLKHDSPKVYVNVRGHTGNFRKGSLVEPKPPPKRAKVTVGSFLEAPPSSVDLYEKKAYSKVVPKKYDPVRHGASTRNYAVLENEDDFLDNVETLMAERTSTTESSMITSSELPKQIPAPPSKVPIRFPVVHTTPVQRHPRYPRIDTITSYVIAEA